MRARMRGFSAYDAQVGISGFAQLLGKMRIVAGAGVSAFHQFVGDVLLIVGRIGGGEQADKLGKQGIHGEWPPIKVESCDTLRLRVFPRIASQCRCFPHAHVAWFVSRLGMARTRPCPWLVD